MSENPMMFTETEKQALAVRLRQAANACFSVSVNIIDVYKRQTQSCISRTQQRMKSPRQKKTEADLQNSLKRKLGNRLPFCYCRSMILSQSRLPVCIPYERS